MFIPFYSALCYSLIRSSLSASSFSSLFLPHALSLPVWGLPDRFIIIRKDLLFVSTGNSLKLQERFDGHDGERVARPFRQVIQVCIWVETMSFLLVKFDYALKNKTLEDWINRRRIVTSLQQAPELSHPSGTKMSVTL